MRSTSWCRCDAVVQKLTFEPSVSATRPPKLVVRSHNSWRTRAAWKRLRMKRLASVYHEYPNVSYMISISPNVNFLSSCRALKQGEKAPVRGRERWFEETVVYETSAVHHRLLVLWQNMHHAEHEHPFNTVYSRYLITTLFMHPIRSSMYERKASAEPKLEPGHSFARRVRWYRREDLQSGRINLPAINFDLFQALTWDCQTECKPARRMVPELSTFEGLLRSTHIYFNRIYNAGLESLKWNILIADQSMNKQCTWIITMSKRNQRAQ